MRIQAFRKIIFVLVGLLTFANAYGQANITVPAVVKAIDFQASPTLSDEAIGELVNKYRLISVAELRQQLAAVKPDQSAAEALKQMPEQWKPMFKESQEVVDTRLWAIGNSVLKLTGAKYDFVLMLNKTPLALSDSNSVLIVSTGMIRTAQDEDGLEGIIGHEVAHGLLVQRTLTAKLKFNEALRAKNWAVADAARVELAKIEIECDLIIAKFMLADGESLASYERTLMSLERFEKDYQVEKKVQWYPESSRRVAALEQLKMQTKVNQTAVNN